tara:strand:+ start:663 stop:1049 length:387 start_codon:yes stop_codon:yes gene_type:complete
MGNVDLQKHFKYEELIHIRMRQGKNLSKIAKYFNSNMTKIRLSNILGQAFLGNYNLNCAEFADKISASKSGTCAIIAECVEAGWVDMYKFDGKTCYKASAEMMQSYIEYFEQKERWCDEIFNLKMSLQ